MIKLLANDGIDPAGKQMLEAAGFTVDTTFIPQDELPVRLQEYDAITVRSATKVRKALIDACPNLKLIGRGGVGVDNIDVEYAKEKGVAVHNTPAASSATVAELVFGHLYTGVRFLQDILGFGRIGREVAKIAYGVGMEVLAYDPFPGPASLDLVLGGGIKVTVPVNYVTKEELIAQSDFISIHTPFTDKPSVGAEEFAQMKKGAGLVNCSRGGTVDEDALLEALNSGKLSFAGLDVFDNEPTPRADILQHPKISLTPHIGASTNEAQERIGVELATLIIDHFKNL
jgi:D-3-phosphoglycerate dehydrogenase